MRVCADALDACEVLDLAHLDCARHLVGDIAGNYLGVPQSRTTGRYNRAFLSPWQWPSRATQMSALGVDQLRSSKPIPSGGHFSAARALPYTNNIRRSQVPRPPTRIWTRHPVRALGEHDGWRGCDAISLLEPLKPNQQPHGSTDRKRTHQAPTT